MKEHPPYQIHLKEPKGDKYFFPQGVIIWPQNDGRGVLQNGVYALRIEGKIKGLRGFQLLERATLYFDGRHRTLSEGTYFGAYAKNGKKVKI